MARQGWVKTIFLLVLGSCGQNNSYHRSKFPLEQSSLHDAVKSKNEDIIKSLLEAGADINEKDDNENTPLHIACVEQRWGIVDFLLSLENIDVTIKNKEHLTPSQIVNKTYEQELLWRQSLYTLACCSSLEDKIYEAAEALEWDFIWMKAVQDKIVSMAFTKLHNALKTRDINARGIQVLLDAGADINKQDDNGNTLLHIVCTERLWDMVEVLLSLEDIDLTIKNKEHLTPFQLIDSIYQSDSTWYESLRRPVCCSILGNKMFEAAEDLKLELRWIKRIKGKITALVSRKLQGMFNGKEMDVEKIQILLDAGADINTQDDYGNTILHHAVYVANAKGVQFLLDRNAKFLKNRCNKTPFSYAVCSSKSVLQAMLERGADIWAQDKYGQTILHHAVASNNVEVVKMLLETISDPVKKVEFINHADNDGNNALALAVKYNFSAVRDVLLSVEGTKIAECTYAILNQALLYRTVIRSSFYLNNYRSSQHLLNSIDGPQKYKFYSNGICRSSSYSMLTSSKRITYVK